jgi:hypothetical protein
MVDEDVVAQSTAEAFGIESCEPEGDLDSVEIATDGNGKFFAILEPFTRAGKTYNENMFRPCQNPADATHGSASIYGITWDIFEDEAE